jgi:cyclopropane fatty-acyl-phospholipid synthase-like methyltransferase
VIDTKTVLDVGCGNLSPLRLLRENYSMTGVDGYQKAINESKARKIHNNYKKMDVRNLSKRFKSDSFDAVVALDLIEHLEKKDGEKLLQSMEKIAKKIVILVTPNGFVPQHNEENGLQEHLSGWNTSDFMKRGYVVQGIYGLKHLRKDGGELRFNPKILTGILSEITHYLGTKWLSDYSYSLMVHKEIA